MLSWIASDFFARSPLLAYPIAALAIFMSLFFAMSLRAAFFAKKEELDELALLPFQGDPSPGDKEARHE